MNKLPKIGRPPKSDKTKMSAKIFINMTETQKKKLVKKAEESQKSLSQICLEALKAQKII
ncbi:hypothetical protein ACOTWJ_09265 [Aliarcobacter butzleri]|uniref:hypothetical protein n=1 Tax=Arcobacter sp. TaxID=1872629 RepID=UPI003B9A3042